MPVTFLPKCIYEKTLPTIKQAIVPESTSAIFGKKHTGFCFCFVLFFPRVICCLLKTLMAEDNTSDHLPGYSTSLNRWDNLVNCARSIVTPSQKWQKEHTRISEGPLKKQALTTAVALQALKA